MAEQERARFPVPRSLEFAQFAIGLLWLLASRSGASSAAQGFARVLHTELVRPVLEQLFMLVLLATGYTALHWIATRNGSVRDTTGLRWRATAAREWQKGAAMGWALLLVALLPMMVAGGLHPQFWLTPQAWGTTLLSLLTLLLAALAIELAYRGYLLQCIVAATGPVSGTILLSLVYAFLVTSPFNRTPFSFFVAFAAGVLYCVAYLRTHALWLGAGVRFGWMASMGVLFGLPLSGTADLAGVVTTESSGQTWLTGGAYGPEGALLTGLVLLAGAAVLFLLTRDYAWAYTHEPIVAGGYPMDVPPPAAHAAMAAAAPPPLVQIGTPAAVSGPPLPRREAPPVDPPESPDSERSEATATPPEWTDIPPDSRKDSY